jgi:mono/diheme cytochrome c family protein
VSLATAIAGGLVIAAAGMAVVGITAEGDDGGRAGAMPTATPAATVEHARDGLAVWVAQGCGSCHTFAAANAHGDIGPDLGSSLTGAPASYIRESIVAPSAHAAPGYTTGMMPEDYASRIAPSELDRLVSFLQANARR